MIPIKTAEEVQKIRRSAEILVETFHEIENILKEGISTKKLDDLAEQVIRSRGAEPAFKGYMGYPASICTSIEYEVVHGIPSDRKVHSGEVISIDIGVKWGGYYSDAAKTYPIGDVSEGKMQLLETTKKALHRGIKKCRSGNRLTDISYAIQTYVESNHFSVVRALVGHGIGESLHEAPQIPNFGPPCQGPKLKEGMVFAIEPMVNMGTCDVTFTKDGWTVETSDRLASAHFEHTVLISGKKPEILTLGIESN
jgi:methionyl aminopeptidase